MKETIFKSSLIKGVDLLSDGKDEKDKTVYHYTSADAFLNIIKNKTIRFTDATFMNDKSEEKYIVGLLIEFGESNKDKYPVFYEALTLIIPISSWDSIKDLTIDKILYRDIPNLPYATTRHFLFCTSTKSNSLSMWNYYVKNKRYEGYNIGLKRDEFLKTFDVCESNMLDPFSVYYSQVLYNKKKQLESIENFVKSVKDKEPEYIAIEIRRFINTLGLFFKHDSFRDEHEYRFLLCASDDHVPSLNSDVKKYFGENNRKIRYDIYARGGILVPYLEIVIPDDAFTSIRISPALDFSIASSGVKELLRMKKIKDLKVLKSKIPIRI